MHPYQAATRIITGLLATCLLAGFIYQKGSPALGTTQNDRVFVGVKLVSFFSMFTKEPDDAHDIHIIPDTKDPAYLFPIHRIQRSRDSNGVITLSGVINVRGDASLTAMPLLNEFYSNVSGRGASGSVYMVKIRFEQATPTMTDAVEVSWLKIAQQLNDPEDRNLIVGMTQTGGNVLQINPMFADARSMKLALTNQPISSKQVSDIIKHTRSVFAHEMAHAMGLSHLRNETKSIVSYAFGRHVTFSDAQAICLLVTNRDGSLCPN